MPDPAPMLPAVELRRVTYRAAGEGWELDVAFLTGPERPGIPYDYFTQLFGDADLTEPVGTAVPAARDGSGVWSEQAAGVQLPPAGDYWLAVVVSARNPPFSETSNALAIVRQAVTLRAGGFDGRWLDIVWEPPASPAVNDYRLSVTAPHGDVLQRELGRVGLPAAGGGMCWRLDLAGVPVALLEGPLELVVHAEVTAGAARATGPGAAAAFPSAPARVTGAETDPVSALATVRWDAVPGAARYLLQRSGTPPPPAVEVDGLDYTLPAPLPPGADTGVTVAAVRSTGAVALTGPGGAPAPLPTARPVLRQLAWDGEQVVVAWSAVPGATGYRASVLAGGSVVGQAQAGPGATALTFDPGLDQPDLEPTVVLQAMTGLGAGPPTDPRPLVEPRLVVPATPAGKAYPHVQPLWGLRPARRELVAHLPPIAVEGTVEAGPFTIEPSGDTAYPQRLRVADDDTVWAVGPQPWRPELRAACDTLLRRAQAAGGTPADILLLQLVLSRLLPQTFPETLFYAYGFDPPNRSVDLRPGVVLRVTAGAWQAVPIGTPRWVSGYAGAGVLDCEVTSYLDAGGAWRVGFDGFAALLAANDVLVVDPPQTAPPSTGEAGVAAAADLFFPLFREAFYRLFLPPRLPDPTAAGSADTTRQYVLAAAPRYTDLQDTRPVPAAGPVAYFRGRAVVTPCIRVHVDGSERVVGIGTTVGALLEGLAQRPPGATARLAGLRLERSLGPAVLDPDLPLDAGRAWPVALAHPRLVRYGPGWDALSLPLLHGDRLTLERR